MWTDGCKHFLSKWFSDETMFSMPGRGNTNWSFGEQKLYMVNELERASPKVNVWCGVTY
jgi:hypothetical protein